MKTFGECINLKTRLPNFKSLICTLLITLSGIDSADGQPQKVMKLFHQIDSIGQDNHTLVIRKCNEGLRMTDPMSEEHARFLFRKIHTQIVSNAADSAHEKLVALRKLAKDKGYALVESEAVVGLAQDEEIKGNFSVSTRYYFEALRLKEKLKDSSGMGRIYNRLGRIFASQGNDKEARLYNEKAVPIFVNKQDWNSLSRTYSNLGIVEKHSGNILKARRYQEKAISMARKGNQVSTLVIALDNLGNTYLSTFESDKCLPLFLESLALQENLKDTAGLIVVTYNLGKSYENIGKLDKALAFYKRSYQLSMVRRLPEDMMYAHQSLSDINEKLKNFREAYYHLQAYSVYKDTLFDESQSRNLNELSVRYQTEEKERNLAFQKKELELVNRKMEQERLIRWLLTGGIALFLLLVFALVYLLRNRMKTAALLQSKNRELEQLNELKNRLFSIIGHDLRQPISSTAMMLDLLAMPGGNPEKKEAQLKEARTLFDHTLHLMDNLLYWSNQQMKGNLEVKKIPVSISELYELAWESMEKRAAEKEIRTETDFAAGNHAIGDPDAIQLILRNLLANAVKFSHSGSAVQIRTEKIGGELILSIKDFGVGMSEELLAKVFSGLSMPGTGGEKGTGLGLGLCKTYANAMGSRLWVESRPGEGTCFYLSLPVA